MNYVISDIHGYYSIYEQVKNMLKPNDKVYFLGDAGDRGPDSWKTITAIYNDPQWVYLKGNHEQMLVDAMKDDLGDDYNRFDSFNKQHLFTNEGQDTYESWANLDENEKIKWYNRLSKLPEYLIINLNEKEYHLSHAGFNPWSINKNYLWDRKHYKTLPNNCFNTTYKDMYIVHGHTPVWYMDYSYETNKLTETPISYNFDHKICIDLGVYETKKSCLYCLDTNSYIILSV